MYSLCGRYLSLFYKHLKGDFPYRVFQMISKENKSDRFNDEKVQI